MNIFVIMRSILDSITSDSCAILVNSSTIPVDSNVIPADSNVIPAHFMSFLRRQESIFRVISKAYDKIKLSGSQIRRSSFQLSLVWDDIHALFRTLVALRGNDIIILFILLSPLPSFGQTPAIPPRLTNFINELEEQKSALQGGAIAILYKGQVVYKTAFGRQSGDMGTINSSTLFPLASGSKAVAATAIALMVDKGSIDLNEKFKLPYLQNQVNLINILSHSTGYHFPGNSQIEQGLSRAKLLSTLQKQQPKCKPGKCYQYSNTTFSLVEEALNRKKLSLKAAIDNMRTVLNTQGIQILPITDNMEIAYPHSRKIKDGKEIITPLPFPPYYPKTIPASAGIFASIDGMIEVFKLSFGYRPDLISQKTLDIMYTPLQSSDDHVKWNFDWPVDQKMIESHYALGWRILRLKGQPKKDLIFHPGFINGINSFMGYIPAEEIGIIILANQRSGFPFKSGVRFWGEFLK